MDKWATDNAHNAAADAVITETVIKRDCTHVSTASPSLTKHVTVTLSLDGVSSAVLRQRVDYISRTAAWHANNAWADLERV